MHNYDAPFKKFQRRRTPRKMFQNRVTPLPRRIDPTFNNKASVGAVSSSNSIFQSHWRLLIGILNREASSRRHHHFDKVYGPDCPFPARQVHKKSGRLL